MFVTITPPSGLPVTLENVKTQLALSSTAFDGLVTALIQTATELAETEINSSIIDTERAFYGSSWCWTAGVPTSLTSRLRIPYGKIHTVSKVEYRSYDGTWNQLDPAVWDWTTSSGQAVIFPKPPQTFPAVALYPVNPVRVTFVSGYGPDRDFVPDAIKHAIRMTACFLFERRDDASTAMPQAALYLLSNHRCMTQEMF